MISFLSKLLDTADFPARWHCGRWTTGHGWLYILSDLAIFAAYTAIPLLLAYFILQRRDAPLPKILWLFVAFILACGVTHLLDAIIFWHPIYRLSAVMRFMTALVSWATVWSLGSAIPAALSLRTPQELEAEVAARTAELRETEQKLREAHDLLEQRVAARTAELQTSNEDLQQFAYIVSHDLKEPLRMVSSFTELLEEEYTDRLDEDGKQYVCFAREGALRMQRQLDAVLHYSRVQSHGGAFAPTPLSAVLSAVLDEQQLRLAESGASVTARPDPLPIVRGDVDQLHQLLANLISNAVKFARPGVPPEITVSAERIEAGWQVSVRDNGRGFAPAHAERIFQIFQRLDPLDGPPGTGLGLAICKRIISRHGGTISADAVLGEGSVFTFTLPEHPLEPTS